MYIYIHRYLTPDMHKSMLERSLVRCVMWSPVMGAICERSRWDSENVQERNNVETGSVLYVLVACVYIYIYYIYIDSTYMYTYIYL